MLSIYNIYISSENATSSESGEKYVQIKHHWGKQSPKLFQTNMSVDFNVREQQGSKYSMEESTSWMAWEGVNIQLIF